MKRMNLCLHFSRDSQEAIIQLYSKAADQLTTMPNPPPPVQGGTIERLIAEGRLRQQPYTESGAVTVFIIDLELFARALQEMMESALVDWIPLREQFSYSTENAVNNAITLGIKAIVDTAAEILYNHLRTVAEAFSGDVRTIYMNNRAPVNMRTELPTFVCELIQSLGCLRIPDAAVDITAIFATSADPANHYGRPAPDGYVAPDNRRLDHITQALRRANAPLSTVDNNVLYGSFWPTVEAVPAEGLYSFVAPFHPSHYTNDDFIRATSFCTNAQRFTPVFSFTAERVDDGPVITQLARARQQGAAAEPLQVQGYFLADSVGIRPAIPALGEASRQNAYCTIIGRGDTRYYCTYLATRIRKTDVAAIWREKFRGTH